MVPRSDRAVRGRAARAPGPQGDGRQPGRARRGGLRLGPKALLHVRQTPLARLGARMGRQPLGLRRRLGGVSRRRALDDRPMERAGAVDRLGRGLDLPRPVQVHPPAGQASGRRRRRPGAQRDRSGLGGRRTRLGARLLAQVEGPDPLGRPRLQRLATMAGAGRRFRKRRSRLGAAPVDRRSRAETAQAARGHFGGGRRGRRPRAGRAGPVLHRRRRRAPSTPPNRPNPRAAADPRRHRQTPQGRDSGENLKKSAERSQSGGAGRRTKSADAKSPPAPRVFGGAGRLPRPKATGEKRRSGDRRSRGRLIPRRGEVGAQLGESWPERPN